MIPDRLLQLNTFWGGWNAQTAIGDPRPAARGRRILLAVRAR